MRCEVVAIGTELLLGQIVDTNSSWLGEQLALAGIDSHFQTKVGDNQSRMVLAIRTALARSDAVIVCGGLGPTQDDITREAIAEVMNVELVRDEEILDRIREMFASRGREMAPSNAKQADVPRGAAVIAQRRGTAPGLICPVGQKVIYAVPGVPYEMKEMFERAILPDLLERSGERSTIVSRTIRTWGLAESTLAEMVQPRIDALDALEAADARPTLAFLASGMEGIKVRITVKAHDDAQAMAMLDEEERELRAILGDTVFGIDDESMESVVVGILNERDLTVATAESMTGGLVASRIVGVPGVGTVFRGGVVSYDSEVKFDVLGVRRGPVVCEEAAIQMAEGVRKLIGADIGLSITGVAGPDEQEGHKPGTAYLGLAMDGRSESVLVHLPGDRERVRQFATISLLDLLRRRLLFG